MTEPTDVFSSTRYRWRIDDSQAVRQAFRLLHRTEQQNVIANIVAILEEAACVYGDHATDLRNEASTQWAFNLPKAPPFPFV